MFVTESGLLLNPQYIINFPTKEHWKNPSKMKYIHEGLTDLVRVIKEKQITSISIPPLGCGNGGLEWNEVRPVIENAISNISNLKIVLFEPSNVFTKRMDEKQGKKRMKTLFRHCYLVFFNNLLTLTFSFVLFLT